MAKMKMGKEMNNKGQVTMFIIVGIIVVVGILTFFLFIQPTYIQDKGKQLGFEGCVADVVEEAIKELELKAGFIDPEFTYPYNGEKLTYLCYTNEYYETCTVQVPFLKNKFDSEMEKLIRDDVNACYENSIDELKAQGYSVTPGVVTYDVLIEPSVVRVEIDAPTSVGGQQFARFNAEVNAPTYDMVMIATSILQFETKYGDADASAMMEFYPDYKITKMKRSDGTTVYILEHKGLGNKFQFASKSLVWPAGYDF